MKKIVIAIIIIAVLGVGGYLYLSSKGTTTKLPDAMTGNLGTSGGVIGSIKDALTGEQSLKCVYKDDRGIETTSYIKSGAVRVMMAGSATPDQPNNIVMKDKTMHMWNDANKTGFIYRLEEPATEIAKDVSEGEELETKQNPKNGDDQQESVLAQIERFKDACKTENITDSMFEIPADVKFQDMDALRNQMNQQGAPSQDDIQKMMQQSQEEETVE